MHKFSRLLAGLALITAILACNLPSQQGISAATTALAQTAAALTVQAALTQAAKPSASAPTATFTPIPSPLPTVPLPTLPPPATATSNCDNAQFIADVTIPDGTTIAAGDHFAKTWRLKNIGTCSWTPSYAVVFFSGDQMGGPSAQALAGNVNPGQTVDLSVNLTAPSSNGNYTGYWKLRNAASVTFAQFYVQIHVGSGGGGGSGGGPFAVTHVEFVNSGGCGSFSTTAKITVNKEGTVTYHWVRSDGATDTAAHAPLDFASAGIQSVSTGWSTTYPGPHWIDIYIDSPNHQQFGRASFNCP
jgi:hypothetical protein